MAKGFFKIDRAIAAEADAFGTEDFPLLHCAAEKSARRHFTLRVDDAVAGEVSSGRSRVHGEANRTSGTAPAEVFRDLTVGGDFPLGNRRHQIMDAAEKAAVLFSGGEPHGGDYLLLSKSSRKPADQ